MVAVGARAVVHGALALVDGTLVGLWPIWHETRRASLSMARWRSLLDERGVCRPYAVKLPFRPQRRPAERAVTHAELRAPRPPPLSFPSVMQ